MAVGVLLVAVFCVWSAAAHPQYNPPVDEYTDQGTHPATVHDAGHSCGSGWDCVPWPTCIGGYIDTSGTGQLDLRKKGTKPPSDLGYTECGLLGNVCCQLPVGAGGIIGGGHGSGGVVGGGHGSGGVVGGGHGSGGVVGGGHGSGGVVGGGHGSGGVVGGGGYDGPVAGGISGPPYPACAAGLLCVEEAKCNLYTGFIGARIPLYEGQPFIEYAHCTTEYLDVGVCCQEAPIGSGVGGGVVSGGGHGGVVGGGGHGGVVGGGGHVGVGSGHGGVGSGVVGGGHGGVVGGGHSGVGGGVVGGGHGGVVGGGHGGVVGGGHGGVGGGVVGGGHSGVGGGVVGGGHSGVGGGVVGGGHGGVGGGVVGGGHGGVGGGVVGGGHGGVGGGVVGVGGGVVGSVHTSGSYSGCFVNEDCVPLVQCRDGVINTDGGGLIDLRKKPDYWKCSSAEYPGVDAVCCRIPDAPPVVSACPDYSICTDRDYCDIKGFIVPDKYGGPFYEGVNCYVNEGISKRVGVCCNPAPVTVITTCPSTSVCIPEDFCFGDLLDGSGAFTPYTPGGSWSECALPDGSGSGVCCNNPPPVVPVTSQCGISHYGTKDDALKTRIHVPKLDKLEADFGELPWQAIVFFSNYTFKCGATLIGEQHLLTVAHCVEGLAPYDIRIRVGEWQVNTFAEPLPYQDLNVRKVIIHPDYKYGPHWNNIAILELENPVKLEYNVNSVCLPFGAASIPAGTRCLVSGWGKDSFEGSYQHILKKIDVPLVDHYDCQALLRKTRLGKYFRLHNSYRCAGGEPGKDACVGDGGGPLICYDDFSKSYVAVGLTAWGIGCGVKDVPGAYTDISKFVPWISAETGIGGGDIGGGGYGK